MLSLFSDGCVLWILHCFVPYGVFDKKIPYLFLFCEVLVHTHTHTNTWVCARAHSKRILVCVRSCWMSLRWWPVVGVWPRWFSLFQYLLHCSSRMLVFWTITINAYFQQQQKPTRTHIRWSTYTTWLILWERRQSQQPIKLIKVSPDHCL